jgi:hypothetical protein
MSRRRLSMRAQDLNYMLLGKFVNLAISNDRIRELLDKIEKLPTSEFERMDADLDDLLSFIHLDDEPIPDNVEVHAELLMGYGEFKETPEDYIKHHDRVWTEIVEEERVKFEACFRAHNLQRNKNGEYISSFTNHCFEGWMERAILPYLQQLNESCSFHKAYPHAKLAGEVCGCGVGKEKT